MNNNEDQQQGQTPFLRGLLGMNRRSLGLHLNEMKILLGSFENKPDLKAITEPWMRECDDPKNFNSEKFQSVESFPRKDAKRRSGEALYCKAGKHCKKISVGTEIECCVSENKISVKTIVICIIKRDEKFRLPQFFSEYEELLYDMKAFNKGFIVFDDFIMDTSKDSTDKMKFES